MLQLVSPWVRVKKPEPAELVGSVAVATGLVLSVRDQPGGVMFGKVVKCAATGATDATSLVRGTSTPCAY